MRMWRILGLWLIVGLTAVACAGQSNPPAETQVSLEVSDFKFTPNTLEVTAGQPVKLTVRNTSVLDHDLSILEIPLQGAVEETGGMEHHMEGISAEPELHIAVGGGQTGTLEFIPTKPGTYEFWCTVAGHKDAGMTGTLVVLAP
jgi:uncharacterized cupredoxin-like copper-binding protein